MSKTKPNQTLLLVSILYQTYKKKLEQKGKKNPRNPIQAQSPKYFRGHEAKFSLLIWVFN